VLFLLIDVLVLRYEITIWAPSHNFVGLYLCNQGTYR